MHLLTRGVLERDRRSIARVISLAERGEPLALELLDELNPLAGRAQVLGLTGAPGTGKSTLCGALAEHYRKEQRLVGILAVDPSSPFSGGAILGDRIRMSRPSEDAGVFIRSMASRGELGGLAPTTYLAARVLDAAGYERILIETVGAGQAEIDIVQLAGTTLVVLVPGLGDEVQAFKAGIMEIADIFVVNKADREGVERLEAALDSLLELTPDGGWRPLVVRTVASRGEGVEQLAAAIEEHQGWLRSQGTQKLRRQAELLLRRTLQAELLESVLGPLRGDGRLGKILDQIVDAQISPLRAAKLLVERGPVLRSGKPWEARPQQGGDYQRPIRDLGLALEGTRLEPVLRNFQAELELAGIRRLKPRFYLSTEWGVPEGSVSIGIPFYLARRDLTALQRERAGYVEGASRADLMRYLRHEMGHVVNYAYRLFEDPEWVRLFGPMTRPYLEEYRLEPFSRRFVRHLPGWYAQKHPDEDWSETFAVWLTPGLDWRAEYSDAPLALEKLEYCDRILRSLAETDPLVTAEDPDEAVSELDYSVEDHYQESDAIVAPLAGGLDGALRAVFEDIDVPEEAAPEEPRRPASELIRRYEPDLVTQVYRWTGHMPESTRSLLRQMATRADGLRQVYPECFEAQTLLALSTLVTAIAMHSVEHAAGPA